MNHSTFDQAFYGYLAASTALTSMLSGGTAVPSIFQHRASENSDPPYVTFRRTTGVPKRTMQRIVHESLIYTVKAVTLGPSAVAPSNIMAQVDALLDDQTFTVPGYSLKFMRRINDLSYTDLGPGGQEYRHVGGMYHILIYPT